MAGTAHAPVACGQCHPKHETYPHPAGIPKPECASCHQKIAQEKDRSVHGKANAAAPDCATCHGGAHEIPRPLSMEFRRKIPEVCGMCHPEIAAEFSSSIHGQALSKGIPNVPVCNDCHGEHLILAHKDPASPVHSRNIRDTCGACHGNLALSRRFGLPSDRLTTFDASFHGLAAKGGSQTVANCASCHGIHNIRPSSDQKATTHPKNLAATCGHCHPGAGSRFALGPIHQSPGPTEPAAVGWVRGFYLAVIPLTIGLMFVHNLGDWIRKMRRSWRGEPVIRAAPGQGELRMHPFERISHAFLASSFLILAWTGFALEYPDHWWARPLAGDARRNVHRAAAVIFCGVGVMHLVSLIANRLLRRHWLELLPGISDFRGALSMLAYNLGIKKQRPVLPSHSYVEKAEYWAVIWGSALMLTTGLMLWANNIVLRWLPKSWLDVAAAIHWYEAILAVLSIFVWHFYSVIFDPDVYPMDTAWLKGRTVRLHAGEEPVRTEDSTEAG